jgi:GxxExxY protein
MDAERATAQSEGDLAHHKVTERVLGLFYETHNELGGGFLESVYRKALAIAFEEASVPFEREMPLPVHFRGRAVGVFKPDFLVANAVIVECKAVMTLDEVHQAQLFYLRATTLEVGLLLNFVPKPQFKRLVFATSRRIRVHPR